MSLVFYVVMVIYKWFFKSKRHSLSSAHSIEFAFQRPLKQLSQFHTNVAAFEKAAVQVLADGQFHTELF